MTTTRKIFCILTLLPALAAHDAAAADIGGVEYPFEYILTENEPASSLETKDNILDQFGRLTSGFYYFTPELDLSGLRNPVMQLWRAPGVYSTSDDGAVALSRESRAVAVTSPRENKPTALPALDKLKVGLGSKVPHGTVITISEWKSSHILFPRYCKKNITKGTLQKDGIRPDGAENDIFRYAEAVFDFCNDTDESAQSLIVVRSNHEFETCDAFDSDQYGAAMICRAITTKGEVAPYLLGVDDQSDPGCRLSYYLRPSGCSNIRLTWRVPAEREDLLVTPGNPGTGMQEDFCYFSYPSYMNAPTLDFDLSYLSTARPDATSTAALVNTGSSGFNPNLAYDFNGNGIKEWLDGDKFKYLFILGGGGGQTTNKVFGSVLGFAPGLTSADPVGYDQNSIFSVGSDFTRTTIYEMEGLNPAVIDFDNDGRPDFLSRKDETVISVNPEGTIATRHLATMTMNEYLGIIPPGPNPLGSGLSIVGDGAGQPAVFASYIQTDINGDGYPDFVDAASGKYYMNLGDGRFVTDSFNGTLLFRDFDDDGINDFLLYDSKQKSISVVLNRIGQDAVVNKLFSGLNCGSDIWCRDFDKDGDIDILVPFNASENNGMAFLVMFENNGQGTFKKKEYPIDGQVDFRALTDWNADGTYEVLCDMELDRENYDSPVGFIPSYTINGLKVSTEPEKIEIHSSVLNNWRNGLRLMGVWDPANDGRTRFMLTSYMALPDAPANTPPAAPASPALAYDEATGELTITWSRGSDKETAAADLTYELRVGTTPGDDNLVRVAATADGKRLNALPGNCGYTLKRKFNTASWPRGEIYVSVQAIDDGGLGSEFSTPAKFLKTAVPAEFSVEAPRGIAIYEELTLQINSLLEADATVAWDLGDGELLAKNAENATVRFRTPGKKSITLRVTLPDGSTGTSSKEIDIAPVRFENTEHTFDIALDLDLDGKMEAHASSFMEGDDAGNYTNVKAIFNTKNYYHLNSADINRDGLPDLIHDSGHLTNAGDKTMDDTTPDNFKKHTFFPDLNNDGSREVYSATGQGGILQNSGNYVDFIEIDQSTFNSTDVQFFDFNGDGLTDAFHLINDSHFGGLSPISEPMRYENLGNFRFRAEPLPMEIDGLQFYYWLVGDFDGNGKADFICMKSGGGYFVLWDNNERTELTRFEDKTDIKFANHVFDYDNNGCMDVFASNDGTMVMFYPDHSVDYVEATGFYSSVFLPFTRTDGVPGVNNAIVRSAPNEKPSAPTGVKGEIIGGNLVISWNAATDKETPSAALRYNLSVKKKSAEGEGAYVISPLNGGVNGVDVPNDAHLIGATRFPIPLFALPKGEYEVKVQAVDGRRATGDFSVPAYITIETSGYDAPAETSVGATTPITFAADVNIQEVDFGEDGVLESVSGTTAYVYWTTEGMKTITAPGLTFTILVHPALDASFSLPEEIPGGAKVYLPADAAFEHEWKLEAYRPSFSVWQSFGVQTPERIDDQTVALTFHYYTGYTAYRLTHTVTAPYGTDTYSGETSGVTRDYQPEIGIVDIDEASGKYSIHPGQLRNDITDFMVYRETETYNQYELIGTMTNEAFVDMDSSPENHTSRYYVKARFWYGESLAGKAHQPIHAQIGAGINGEWNISWNRYEGRDATTYRVLRGATPDALTCIAEVPGSTTAYTDRNADASTRYYAVETLIAKPTSLRNIAYWRSRSNTVSTDASGLDNVAIDTMETYEVYNTAGILVRSAATRAELEALPAGLYIVNGEKVVIRH